MTPTRRSGLPLAGIRVLDLTRILAGPYCTMKLGDMGAEVIKIERPGRGDDTRSWAPPYVGDESAYYFSINRNKKSVELDLSSASGKTALRKLLEQSDVLVENFLPGSLSRLGFSPGALARKFPRLVHCTITGYGSRTSRRNDPAYELIVQGESGLMDLTGFPGGPPVKSGISISDVTAGNHAFEGILLALYRRERTGRGGRVEVGLLESIISAFSFQAQIALATAHPVGRMGNLHPTITPYEMFKTRDGYMNIAVASEPAWEAFCSAIGQPKLSGNARFRTNPLRVCNRTALRKILTPIIRRKTTGEWLKLFMKHGIAAGRVNTLHEALRAPGVADSGLIVNVKTRSGKTVRMVGNAIKISGMKPPPPLPPPYQGEHTEQVLRRVAGSKKTVKRPRG